MVPHTWLLRMVLTPGSHTCPLHIWAPYLAPTTGPHIWFPHLAPYTWLLHTWPPPHLAFRIGLLLVSRVLVFRLVASTHLVSKILVSTHLTFTYTHIPTLPTPDTHNSGPHTPVTQVYFGLNIPAIHYLSFHTPAPHNKIPRHLSFPSTTHRHTYGFYTPDIYTSRIHTPGLQGLAIRLPGGLYTPDTTHTWSPHPTRQEL